MRTNLCLSRNGKTNKGKLFFIVFVSIIALCVSFAVLYRAFERSLDRASEINMLSFLLLWEKNGKTNENNINEFIKDGRFWDGVSGILVTNHTVAIGNTSFVAQFAMIPRHTNSRILLSSTNSFIWVTCTGKVIGKPKAWKK